MGNTGVYRHKLGAFEVLALHDGVLVRDRPPGFVRNVDDATVGQAFAQAGMARDKLTITFTPLAVRTEAGVVLIDTGFGQSGPEGTGKLVENLAAAGVQRGDVSTVIISHCHGDHILGLAQADGSATFPDAQVMAPAMDLDYWLDPARLEAAPAARKQNFDVAQRVLGPMAGSLRRYAWGDEMLPGFRAVEAGGHTPGMAAIEISSEGERMLFVADITNNPLLFVRNPGWQAMFDVDAEAAVVTRRRILDRAAAENLLLFFFHAPFPGLAYVVKNGDGYEYLPALWR